MKGKCLEAARYRETDDRCRFEEDGCNGFSKFWVTDLYLLRPGAGKSDSGSMAARGLVRASPAVIAQAQKRVF
jgi:hypothetical protein